MGNFCIIAKQDGKEHNKVQPEQMTIKHWKDRKKKIKGVTKLTNEQ